jgi:hypothetical protein
MVNCHHRNIIHLEHYKMTQLPLILDDGGNDNTPLPLIVANRWNFPLAHIPTDDGLVYAVQDWMRGLLGGDIRRLLAKLRRHHPDINTSIKMLPYTSTDNKVYQRPYTDEDRLMSILINTRLSRGRSRLVGIRNYIADFDAMYEYLRCSAVKEKGLVESEFQTDLVAALKSTTNDYEIHEYYPTSTGRVIDILAFRKHSDSQLRKSQSSYLLIECKANREDFYKAVGQVICYDAEISGSAFCTNNRTLAIAMPYELIDDYIVKIVTTLGIRLISIVENIAIDAVTGEPFYL